jgi:hypothetical protein
LERDGCELSTLSFCRKFASFDCEPQELRGALFNAVQEIIAYNVIVSVVENEEAEEEAA